MLTVTQASETLGVSSSKLYQLVARREISYFRIGAKILFEPSDLEAFKAKCRVGAAVPPPPPRSQAITLKHVSLAAGESLAPATGGRNAWRASTDRNGQPAPPR